MLRGVVEYRARPVGRCDAGWVAHEVIGCCRFSTDRLVVGEWHDLAFRHAFDLIDVVGCILTEATTGALPRDWQGSFDSGRSAQWIRDRDAESPTLLVIDREENQGVGLLILFEADSGRDHAMVDVRLGYVFAEDAWGRGLASELVGGLVEWARSEPSIASLSGGVAERNSASAKVLVKNDFEPGDRTGDERIYCLRL